MTDSELRKLGRTDLLEMLLEQKKENDRLAAKVADLETQLENRRIKVEKAGTLAEASLLLNGVFEAAEEACRQYVENIQTLSQQQETICAQMEKETRTKCYRMERETKEKCDRMIASAKRVTESYWSEYAARYGIQMNQAAQTKQEMDT